LQVHSDQLGRVEENRGLLSKLSTGSDLDKLI
jgi:hypothetical protein